MNEPSTMQDRVNTSTKSRMPKVNASKFIEVNNTCLSWTKPLEKALQGLKCTM